MFMEREKETSNSMFSVIEVLPSGDVRKIEEGSFVTHKKYPTKPGIYQLRPVARMWSASAEHGAWIPVSEWAPGVIEAENLPPIMELPEIGIG